ncbi:MAG: hypothetical protein E7652_08575 [Ruminococcaceae bacterium]|nr:hypothetical protein [Oscillospiraceae bacterium]
MKFTKLTAMILAALLCAGMLVSCTGEKKSSTEDKETVIEEKEEKRTEEGSDESVSKKEEVKATEKIEETTEPEETEPITEDIFVSENPTLVYGTETITFGAYEQDNNTSNGMEAIEWIVLAKEDGKVLVTSKYGLDVKPYNEEYAYVMWEDCTLRKWMNNDFYNTAFSESEKSQIETTYVVNDGNEEYGTTGGNDTNDKVFLLSADEVEEYFNEGEECCKPTEYCKSLDVYTNLSKCRWWLRTPGINPFYTTYVFANGFISDNGNDVDNGDSAVRPAMWISLEG